MQSNKLLKRVLTFTLSLCSLAAFSQVLDSLALVQLQENVGQLKTELTKQQADFSKKLLSIYDDIAQLRADVETLRATSLQTVDSLEMKIINTQTNTAQQIHDVQQKVSHNTLYWIIAVLSIALLSMILFIWLSKKQQSVKMDMIEQLSKTKSAIEESLVTAFGQQTELMEAQMELVRQQKGSTARFANAEPDHSLALEVANEITLMERNISHMNQETKGLKPLIRAIERLKDHLNANGYELVELLGKPYNEGMKITIVGTASDENMDTGTDIITKIIKPQVNYNDKMIQMAQVEVTVGVN